MVLCGMRMVFLGVSGGGGLWLKLQVMRLGSAGLVYWCPGCVGLCTKIFGLGGSDFPIS